MKLLAIRLLVAIVLMASVLCAGGGNAFAKSKNLDGRLGGTRSSVDKAFGEPFKHASKVRSTYRMDAFPEVAALFHDDRAVEFKLAAPESGWSAVDAIAVVGVVLPLDAKRAEVELPSKSGTFAYGCRSTALAKVITSSDMTKLKFAGSPGDCHYEFTIEDEKVTTVTVAAGLGSATALPTESPEATATAATFSSDGYASGGLGLSLTDWEAAHGHADSGSGYPRSYDGGRIAVYPNESGIISEIDLEFENFGSSMPLDEARGGASSYLPADASRVDSYELPELLALVDVYHSDSLIDKFPDPSAWTNASPGDFIIIFEVDPDTGWALDALIVLGNNP